LDEGTYDFNFCYTGQSCFPAVWNLGANHVMTDNEGNSGTWKYVGITHTLTVTYTVCGGGICNVYSGTGTPEKGFSGTISAGGSVVGTWNGAEPAGV
jgi:hypothetical protein